MASSVAMAAVTKVLTVSVDAAWAEAKEVAREEAAEEATVTLSDMAACSEKRAATVSLSLDASADRMACIWLYTDSVNALWASS